MTFLNGRFAFLHWNMKKDRSIYSWCDNDRSASRIGCKLWNTKNTCPSLALLALLRHLHILPTFNTSKLSQMAFKWEYRANHNAWLHRFVLSLFEASLDKSQPMDWVLHRVDSPYRCFDEESEQVRVKFRDSERARAVLCHYGCLFGTSGESES